MMSHLDPNDLLMMVEKSGVIEAIRATNERNGQNEGGTGYEKHTERRRQEIGPWHLLTLQV